MTRATAFSFACMLLIAAGGCTKSSNSPASPVTSSARPISSPEAAGSTSSVAGVSNDERPVSDAAPKSDQDAIRDALAQHLASNSTINMAAMDMNVVETSVNGDQAQANVEFRLKQGGTTMQMTYFLIRHAGGWLVSKGQPGGGQFAHPPMDKQHAGAALGSSPNSGASGMPDVHDFFAKVPATKPSRTVKTHSSIDPNSP